MDIRRTTIYRSIAPRVRKQDRRELARMLKLAREAGCNFDPDATEVISALVWSESPQGADWWWELHESLRVAKGET